MKKQKKSVAKKSPKAKSAKKASNNTKPAPIAKEITRLPGVRLSPVGDRVVVSLELDEKVTASGIIIPETVDKERPDQGKVVAVGPGKVGDDNERIPLSVKVGDIILFAKYGPDEIKLDGKKYYIISESNILAVIE